MSKRSRSKKSPKGEISFCYEMTRHPRGVQFSDIDTATVVVLPFCPDHAGSFIWHVGKVFLKLPCDQRKSFKNNLLLFVDHIIKNPHLHANYQFDDEADIYLEYLAGQAQDDGLDVACYADEEAPKAAESKKTLH